MFPTFTRLVILRHCHVVSPNMASKTILNLSIRPAKYKSGSEKLRQPMYVEHFSRFNNSVLSLAYFANKSIGIKDSRTMWSNQYDMPRILEIPKTSSESYFIKRFIGRSSRYQDIDVNNNIVNGCGPKCKLHERTRSVLTGRVMRIRRSILIHKTNLKNRIGAQKEKGAVAVGKFHRQLRNKVDQFSQKEDVKTIPNLLTTLRMASAPVLAYLVVNESFGLACSLFVVAGITDLLDGYIARNFKNQRTALGTALDPLADKLLVSFLTVSLTYAGLIAVPVTTLIISRDVCLIAATFYIRYISLAPPRTLSRYFDVSHVTAKLYPSLISKVNTALQLSFVALTLASPIFDYVGHPWLQALMYLTATTTFLSGADYLLTWKQRLQIIKNK